MITPTRFGLKYAPVPTLALEYEVERSASVDDGGGTTSLYVYDRSTSRESGDRLSQRVKKLHVVELPALTRQSEIAAVARQLQQDNRRFLAPDVVKEDQLVRLLERLMAHAQVPELSVSASLLTGRASTGDDAVGRADVASASRGMSRSHDDEGHLDDGDEEEASDAELEESAMDESIAEASASMDASERSDDHEASADGGGGSAFKVVSAGGEGNDSDDDTQETANGVGDKAIEQPIHATSLAHVDAAGASGDDGEENEAEKREAEADAAKIAALKKEDDASDGEEAVSEEDIQSEELEYFSENGSDEDSF